MTARAPIDPLPPAEGPPPEDGSALCLACGLCCTGHMFDHVTLREDELAAAARHRLPIVPRGDHTSFRQPCPHHGPAGCGIYEERPHACRLFRCRTLAAYQAGDIDRPTADARIEALRSMAAHVAAQLPPGSARTLGVWTAAQHFTAEADASPDPAAFRARHAPLFFDLLELSRLCKRDFHDPPR